MALSERGGHGSRPEASRGCCIAQTTYLVFTFCLRILLMSLSPGLQKAVMPPSTISSLHYKASHKSKVTSHATNYTFRLQVTSISMRIKIVGLELIDAMPSVNSACLCTV